MNAKNVEEILTVLAARFGTTAAHLWEVLIRQAYVNGVLAVFWVVVSAIIVYNAVVRFPKAIDGLKKARFEDEPPFIAQAFLWGAAFVIFIVVGGTNIDTAVQSFGNTEYAALKLVLGAFSN